MFLKKLCLFKVCNTVYQNIRPAGYSANETEYPAEYLEGNIILQVNMGERKNMSMTGNHSLEERGGGGGYNRWEEHTSPTDELC